MIKQHLYEGIDVSHVKSVIELLPCQW